MKSPRSELLGVQEPRFLTLPPSADQGRAGAEAIELGQSAGIELFPWQEAFVTGGLSERPDGRCAAPTVAVVVPRQNGKDEGVLVAELAWLYLYESVRLITHTAHRFDTCLEHFYRLLEVIERTPDLRRKVRRVSMTNGKEAITLRDGCRIQFKARAKGSGRGFTGDRIVFNEAMRLIELGSMVPSLSARPDPQLWFTSSAPLDGPESDELRKIIRRGRAGDPTLMYAEHSAEPDADLDDPAALAQANPSLGVLLSPQWVAEQERLTMSDDEYGRERLGIFNEHQDGHPPKIEPRHWKLCVTKERPDQDKKRAKKWMRNPVTFGLAVTPDREWASIGAAGRCREGGTAIEVVEHRPGTDWVAGRLAELCKVHKALTVAVDPRSPAGSLIAALRTAGVNVITECNTSDHVKAAGQFYDAVKSHDIVHRASAELDAAVAVAIARPVGDGFLFDRRGDIPISPLECVELAAWAHHTLTPVDLATQVF